MTTTRPKPDDFWTTYVEVGMTGAQEYYRAHRLTVRAWCVEEGLEAIRAARSAFVAAERARLAPRPKQPKVVMEDANPPDPYDLKAACQYLRERAGGSWRVGLRDDGNYFVGSREMVGSEVVAMAVARGMDEWYIERDAMRCMALSDGIDEWVLDNEAWKPERSLG